jgi:cobalt/nickel transport system permease protein
MVHISDGILAPEIWITGFIITGIILILSVSKIKLEDIPKLSMVTGAMFIASLIHIPIGPSSVHLILASLAGILLGFSAYPAIFIATLFQALFFQHGGISTLGINTLILGLPALAAAGIFWMGVQKTNFKQKYLIFGSIASIITNVLIIVFVSTILIITGQELFNIMLLIMISHIPVIIIEASFIGGVAEFLSRIKPEMLSWVIKSKTQFNTKVVSN